MEIRLVQESIHYKIYTTRHINPFEEDSIGGLFNLMEMESEKGFKLQTIFFYNMELVIVFSVFK